jgi:hypothetical protein
MLADPELAGDLLLIGLAWARAVHLGDPGLKNLIGKTAKLIYGAGIRNIYVRLGDTITIHRGQGAELVASVLRADARRYEAERRDTYCQRPVRRRDGGEGLCLRNAAPNHKAVIIDPHDGTQRILGACHQARCVDWLERLAATNQAACEEHPSPAPVANRGGVLARRLPEFDWPVIWRGLDPKWVPPRELESGIRPTLRVLVNGELSGVTLGRVRGGMRPALTGLPGGAA